MEIKINTDTVLLFDMDGTLIDTDFANFLSFKIAIQSVIGFNTKIIYNPDERFNRTILKRKYPNLTKNEYNEIVRIKELNYVKNLVHTKIVYFVYNILTQYSTTNTTILVTKNYHNLTHKFTQMFFRKIVQNDYHVNKFENVLTSLKLSPKSVLVFENENAEIEEAIKAGIPLENIILI